MTKECTETALGIVVAGKDSFALLGRNISYHFHVDSATEDVIHDHYGGFARDVPPGPVVNNEGWTGEASRARREFPDFGRGDFRSPAIRVEYADGNCTTALKYQNYEILNGKARLAGLPSSFDHQDQAQTLVIHLYDELRKVAVDLQYSIFPELDIITRSFKFLNQSDELITIKDAQCWSTDFQNQPLELIGLHGDWGYEMNRVVRPVQNGKTGFASSSGFSSAHYNPSFALAPPSTNELTGPVYGFLLVYTGSFSANIERSSHGAVRVQLGLNPLHLDITVKPQGEFVSPEVISTYTDFGLGCMSRTFHDFFRNNLMRAPTVRLPRPVLLNHWEGLEFRINADLLTTMAQQTADLGLKLFVMDDAWFGGEEYPRDSDQSGLGDWEVNPKKFPMGLAAFIDNITSITVADTKSTKLKFGIWIEPEMVNQQSLLYQTHPDWVLQADCRPQTTIRNQLILNLGLREVQDFIIDMVTNLLSDHSISYVKWDSNRGMHEIPNTSSAHTYILGLYRILDTVTSRFPNVLWEGCASGGGRIDGGLAHYWPQFWTSDNTDARDRLSIQFGTSLFYPPSALAGHISVSPNEQTGRASPLLFRAHAAMMCGSFGLELDPQHFTQEEKAQLQQIIRLAEEINPIIIGGDFYRLGWPDQGNWPAAQFMAKDGENGLVFAFQLSNAIRPAPPRIKLQQLDPNARYCLSDDNLTVRATGAALMNIGFNITWAKGDLQSRLLMINKS